MNKILKIVFITAFLLGMFSCTAFAADVSTFNDQTNVELFKTWIIGCTDLLDKNTVNSDNIVITDDKNNKANINIRLIDKDNKTVVIDPPAGGYKPSTTYTLKINNLKSVNNALLKNLVSMKFTTVDNKAESFDVDVKVNIKITLEDSVKGVNTNIIKAARAAMFGDDSYMARFSSYNGFSINEFVDIFEVNQKSDDTWEVKYRVKESQAKEYDTNTYCSLIVKRDDFGSYMGYISHGSPLIKIGETF